MAILPGGLAGPRLVAVALPLPDMPAVGGPPQGEALMSASAKTTVLELQAVNGLLCGARIKKVLLGHDAEETLLVIETDRRHPELGGAYTLQMRGSFALCVGVSIIERLPGELMEP